MLLQALIELEQTRKCSISNFHEEVALEDLDRPLDDRLIFRRAHSRRHNRDIVMSRKPEVSIDHALSSASLSGVELSRGPSMKLLAAILVFSSPAFAGNWICNTGLDGRQIVKIEVRGNEQATLRGPASMATAPFPGVAMFGVLAEQAAPNELSRSVIGYEDPRSKTRLRIMKEEISPNVYKAFTLLVNFGIKQEMDGACAYTL